MPFGGIARLALQIRGALEMNGETFMVKASIVIMTTINDINSSK